MTYSNLSYIGIDTIPQNWVGFTKTKVKILLLTKLNIERDFAFINFTTMEARKDLLTNGLTFHNEDSMLASRRTRTPTFTHQNFALALLLWPTFFSNMSP